jgi:dienelactone hydrolase
LTSGTRNIEYRLGDDVFEGVFACNDDGDTPRPGVLVAHTVRGRTEFEEARARALADAGYAAMALDVYGKDNVGSGLEKCRELMGALRADRPLLQRRLLAALNVLRDQPEVDASRTAAIGFCFGGMCVLDIARTGEDIAGVVSFHGLFDPPGNAESERIVAKILVLHGWDDPLAKPDEAVALAAELSAAGADWQIHAYGNVLHAFTNPAADASTGITVYNADADRRSWAAMHYFLSELFGS